MVLANLANERFISQLFDLKSVVQTSLYLIPGYRKIVMRPPILVVHGTLTGLTVTMEIN